MNEEYYAVSDFNEETALGKPLILKKGRWEDGVFIEEEYGCKWGYAVKVDKEGNRI